MGKILVFLFALPVLLSVLTYFWISVKRKWSKEDRLEIQEQRRQALLEFKESEETLDSFINARYDTPKKKREPLSIPR